MKLHELIEIRIARLRTVCRTMKLSIRTEQSYAGWVRRYITSCTLDKTPEANLRDFLESKADVWAAATQNQALNAIVFYYKHVLERPLGKIGEWAQAKRPARLPVWLAHADMMRLIDGLRGVPRLMAMVAYGGGPRSMELVRARLKDVNLEQRTLTIRGGKGMKDRVTILPDSVIEPMRNHIAECERLWMRDRQSGRPGVEVPSVKFNGTDRQWFWLWPARGESVDPITGITRRHHLHESTLAKATTAAVKSLGMNQRVTVHSYRHSFATSLLLEGTPIQEVQQLLGHVHIATTQIYAHCLPRVELRIRSPLDAAPSKIVPFAPQPIARFAHA